MLWTSFDMGVQEIEPKQFLRLIKELDMTIKEATNE